MFRIGGNTFYDGKNKIPKKIPEFKRSRIGLIAEFLRNSEQISQPRTRTGVSLMVLQLIFGMTYTNLDDYLLFTKRIIVMVLRDHPMAQVRIPSSEKIEEYKDMVH